MEEKVNALRDHILEKCREQGVTISEFERLLMKLSRAKDKRKSEILDALLIPKDKAISDYHHVF